MLWSDESKFEIFGSNYRVFVRRRKGERMDSTCLVPTVKHGGGGVMVWGCFAGDTVGDLFKIEGILNQHLAAACYSIRFAFQGLYYLLKLIKRMPRVCKAVIKAKGGYFGEPRMTYFQLFHTFLLCI